MIAVSSGGAAAPAAHRRRVAGGSTGLAATALFVPLVLLLDGPSLPRQLALGLATALFLWLFVRRTNIPRRQILTAIIVATIGEVILSIVWGLYHYRFALLPLYVPFGHGLFYAMAAASAPRLQIHEKAIVRGVLIAGSLLALVQYRDQWGLIWWIAAAAILLRSRNQLLLSVCVVYTMLLEWLGTALGNWTWAAIVPGLGLRSGNPPSGVGILYLLLDLITVAICSRSVLESGQPEPLSAV